MGPLDELSIVRHVLRDLALQRLDLAQFEVPSFLVLNGHQRFPRLVLPIVAPADLRVMVHLLLVLVVLRRKLLFLAEIVAAHLFGLSCVLLTAVGLLSRDVMNRPELEGLDIYLETVGIAALANDVALTVLNFPLVRDRDVAVVDEIVVEVRALLLVRIRGPDVGRQFDN